MRSAALIYVCPLLLAAVVHADDPKTSWKVKLLYPHTVDRERSGYVIGSTNDTVCECRTVCQLSPDGKCIQCKTGMIPVTYTTRHLRRVPLTADKSEAAAENLKNAKTSLTEATTKLAKANEQLKAAEEWLAAAKAKPEAVHELCEAIKCQANAACAVALARSSLEGAESVEKYAVQRFEGFALPPTKVATHRIKEYLIE